MLASIGSRKLTEWRALYIVEDEDEREASEKAKVRADLESRPRPRRVLVAGRP